MGHRAAASAVALWAAFGAVPVRAAGGEGPVVLGGPPLCEASAALRAPWDPGIVLVADNEHDEGLFAFREDAGRLAAAGVLPIPGRGRERPRDVEALAALGDRLLVVGSWSPDRRCRVRENRRRLLLLRRDATGGGLLLDAALDLSDTLDRALRDERACLTELFTSPPPPLAASACRALARPADPCASPNVEAAVTGGDGAVWLGFRSPLVGGRLALLLRLRPALDALRFDAAATIDLGGLGLREALPAPDGSRLLVIAGPADDAPGPFALFSVPLPPPPSHAPPVPGSVLVPGAALVADPGSVPLPPSAEGLIAAADHVTVLLDGDRGDGPSCREPSRQLRVPLPRAPQDPPGRPGPGSAPAPAPAPIPEAPPRPTKPPRGLGGRRRASPGVGRGLSGRRTPRRRRSAGRWRGPGPP